MTENGTVCGTPERTASEIVICDSTVSMDAHQELFRLATERYVLCSDSLMACMNDVNGIHTIHLSLLWGSVLKVALWKEDVTISDAIYLLLASGMNDGDVAPFRNGNVDDIFPALYYGKNFDVLRKLCNTARKTAEKRLSGRGPRINCHLVAEDSCRIVASSL